MQPSVRRAVTEALVTYQNNGKDGTIPLKHMINPGPGEQAVDAVFGKLVPYGFKNDFENGNVQGHHHFKNRGFIILHQSRHHAFTTFGEISLIGAKRYMPWVALCLLKAKQMGGYPQVQGKISVQGTEAGMNGDPAKTQGVIWQFIAKSMGVQAAKMPDEKQDAKLFHLFDMQHETLDHPAEDLPSHVVGLHTKHGGTPEKTEVINQLHKMGIDLDKPAGEIQQFDIAKIRHDPSVFQQAQDLGILSYDQHGNLINYMLEAVDLASLILAVIKEDMDEQDNKVTEAMAGGAIVWGNAGTSKIPDLYAMKNGVKYLYEEIGPGRGTAWVMTEDGYSEPLGDFTSKKHLAEVINRHHGLLSEGKTREQAASLIIESAKKPI